jgi:hypothetical protein
MIHFLVELNDPIPPLSKMLFLGGETAQKQH